MSGVAPGVKTHLRQETAQRGPESVKRECEMGRNGEGAGDTKTYLHTT